MDTFCFTCDLMHLILLLMLIIIWVLLLNPDYLLKQLAQGTGYDCHLNVQHLKNITQKMNNLFLHTAVISFVFSLCKGIVS